jgi:hypothetical protein
MFGDYKSIVALVKITLININYSKKNVMKKISMQPFSHLSIIRGLGYLLLLTLLVNCKKDFNANSSLSTKSMLQPNSSPSISSQSMETGVRLSQTRTATYLNNLNQFREVFGDQNYPKALATDVSADDGKYAFTSKLAAKSDSGSSFTSNSVSTLALQGFGFTIPESATIQNISIRVKRFKQGKASVGDHTLSLMQRFQSQDGTPSRYGVFWSYQEEYTGKVYPSIKTEYVFSQSGGGNDGGFNNNQFYQWTPTMINQITFGVRIDNYIPIGTGSVTIYYDLVEVTVEYSPAE